MTRYHACLPFAVLLAFSANAAPPECEEDKSSAACQEERLQDDTIWQGERMEITARGTVADFPSTLATTVLDYQETVAMPSDFQDWIIRTPGVGATGQNGVFETFSIRGLTGNRILNLVAGVPITSQRRAGVPLSFVEPYLLGDVIVTRGPSVVHFGGRALGGAISVEPRWFDAPFGVAGYATAGDEKVLVGATGSEHWSVAVARHGANDAEAPNGVPLDTSFERTSGTFQFRNRFGDWTFDALLMPSRTEDIGKSNKRFPNIQRTTYPLDEHTIARARLRHDGGWQASFYVHDQELETSKNNIDEPQEFAFIGSTDGGATVQRIWTSGDFTNNIGVEYFTRRDVTGFDAVGNPDNRTFSLNGASADTWSLFGITDWRLSETFALELGARAARIEQEQGGGSQADSAAAFTAGAVWTPTHQSRWSFNVATGYRFPTLEERFFTGVTGRGEIVGNPNLGAAQSFGADLGYAWRSADWDAEIHAWRLRVDDFIQKIELQPDVFGYVNLGHGDLYGAEASVGWQATPALALRAGGAWVEGEDQTGRPLYGIPPVRASLEGVYEIGRFQFAARYAHRFEFDEPGPEEVSRDAVDLVSAELRYHLSPTVDLEVFVRNAFDELYFATADELSTFAVERSVGVNIIWAAD